MKPAFLQFLAILLCCIFTPALIADDSASVRPIEDFVSAQGTFCVPDDFDDPDCERDGFEDGCFLFVKPVKNFLGWSWFGPKQILSASVDYAGLADQALGGILGTTFSGKVVERPLADGRIQVTVNLETKNALTWVVDGSSFACGPVVYGARVDAIQHGAAPVLGQSTLHLQFITPPLDGSLPDLLQLAYYPEEGQELTFLSFYADSTQAQIRKGISGVTVVQTGLFMTQWQGATADGFPAERIVLHRVREKGNRTK